MEKHNTIQTIKVEFHEYLVDPITGKALKGKKFEIKNLSLEEIQAKIQQAKEKKT